MRKAVVGAAAALAILVFAAAAVPRIVRLDGTAARVVAVLGKTTGRTIGFSRASLVLFPAIAVRVADLEISGDPGHPDEKLLMAPSADFRFAVIPLLAGRAEFTKVVFHRPAIVFRKGRDGTTSLSTAVASLAAPPARPVPAAGAEPKGELVVRTEGLVVEDGTASLRLEDSAGSETRRETRRFSLRVFGIGTRDVDVDLRTTLAGAVRGSVRFQGRFSEAPARYGEPGVHELSGTGDALDQRFSVQGTVADPFGRLAADLAFSFPRIRVDEIPGLLSGPGWLDGRSPEGIASLSVKLSGEPDEFGFEAEADLTRAGWIYRPGIRKFIDVPFSVVVQGRRFPDQVIVSNAEFRFPPLLLIANASRTFSTGAREWTASARISSLEEFAKSRGGMAGWSPAGVLTASGKGRRAAADSPEEWLVDLDLGNAGLQIPGQGIELRGVNGHIEAGPRAVSFLPVAGLINGQGFSLRGTVAHGAAKGGQIDLRMAYLDLDSIVAGTSPVFGRSKGLSAHAVVRIDAGKAGRTDFRDFHCAAVIDNGVIRIDSARAGFLGGTASLSGRIDAAGPSPGFRVNVSGNGVRLGELLAQRTSLADFLSGKAAFSADIAGGMKDFDDFARTAAGSGFLRMTDGRIKGVDIPGSAVAAAGLSKPSDGARTTAGGPVKGETPFSEISAAFRLARGKARTDNLRIVSRDMSLEGAAAVGLDGTLDLMGTVTFPKDAPFPRAAAGRFLVDASGRVAIPVIMSGALASPAIAVDSQALARQAPGSGRSLGAGGSGR